MSSYAIHLGTSGRIFLINIVAYRSEYIARLNRIAMLDIVSLIDDSLSSTMKLATYLRTV